MLKLLTEESLKFNLDEIIREGTKLILAKALEAEIEDQINKYRDIVDEKGHRLVVRNGKAKKRTVNLGSGTIEIEAPRIHDRREGQKFTSAILPPFVRKSPGVENLIPTLFLLGISTGKMTGALEDFFGEGTVGLSPATVSKLIKSWEKDFEFLKNKRFSKIYAYMWADGVNVKIRLGDDKKVCLPVIIGVTEDGEKELVGVQEGYRESKESWLTLMRDLADRGFKAPMLAIGDGALGFWSALRD